MQERIDSKHLRGYAYSETAVMQIRHLCNFHKLFTANTTMNCLNWNLTV